MNFTKAWNLVAQKMMGWARDFVLLLPNLLLAVLVVVLSWLVAQLVRNVVARLLKRVSHSEQVTWLLAQVAYVAILAAGLFIALGVLGLQKTVASLMAGAGIITLALGFAFQDIGANLMAGIYLAVRRPFRRGQLIKTQDFFGTVHEVNLRWTEVYTPQGQLVMIPNKQVFENPIMNYSSLGRRRIDLNVGVSYRDDLARAREVAIRAVEEIPQRLPERSVELYYEEIGESSINFVVRFWIPFSKQGDYLEARSEAIERIKRAFDAEGITMPFPTRTLDFSLAPGPDGTFRPPSA